MVVWLAAPSLLRSKPLQAARCNPSGATQHLDPGGGCTAQGRQQCRHAGTRTCISGR
ncbi:hypothetical protein GQ53DRAFT_743798 [Thozetella sp. PMI_491]|nr:hypothetical protein GQ53DRAFT_743798 [Thozetella sp. PMI_491]